jgi:tripeptidyl-peptidase-1
VYRFFFRYGAHLSKEQVAELVAPHPDTLELISSWLQYNGVPPSSISTTHGGGWLTVAGVPVSQANQLLGASYQVYYHTGTKKTILRTVGYALPATLHTHVRTVAPTTVFSSTRLLQQTPRTRSSGAAAQVANAAWGEPVDVLSPRAEHVDPPFLRWLYDTTDYVPAATVQNVLGIVGLENEYPSQMDLTAFMTHFRADAVAATVRLTIELVNDGEEFENDPDRQANLDTQYSGAMTYPTPVIYYTIGGDREIAPNLAPASGNAYLEWFEYLLRQRSIPQTISVAYGPNEQSITMEYAADLCLLFGQLGLRGASVLVASGDDGVGAGNCRDFSGNVRFYTTFPASCTCGVASCPQAQVQFAHQTVVISQVPLSQVSAER